MKDEAKRKIRIGFTMVFEDGERLTDCLHVNVLDSDEEIIDSCNLTNPVRWGQVVAIEDRYRQSYWV